MRLEATVPDSRGAAVQELADQLQLTRSQIIDEALALFLKAVLEVRRGRRLVTVAQDGAQAACELTTPTLTSLEWSMASQTIQMPDAALEAMQKLVDAAPTPSPRLRAAAVRQAR